MADAEQVKLHAIFRDSVLNVPRYQRSYAWDKQQVTDLLNDVEYLYEERQRNTNADAFHYFGTVVLHEQGTVGVDKTDTFTKYDVVDGQQRLVSIAIFIQCIDEALESIEYSPAKESEERTPEQIADKNRQDYIYYSGQNRLGVDTQDQDVYEDIVLDGGDINTQTTIPSQERLIQAKRLISNWLANKYKSSSDETDYFEFLKELTGIISNDFQVTKYTVSETNEAGRLFEVVNDRGRSLTTLDKIKSYLIYCTSRIDDEDLSRKVYRTVSEVIENVTENGSEKEVRVFVREHWRIFTGEVYFHRSGSHDITELHRRIKKIDKHASLDRSDGEIKKWIEQYLRHIREASISYREVMNPEIIQDAYSSQYVPTIVKRLYGIHLCTQPTARVAILVAAHMKYGISQEFEQIVELFEKFAFRSYHIAHERADLQREQMRWIAYRMVRAGEQKEMRETFGYTNDEIDVYSDEDDALSKTCRAIEDAIGWYCPRSRFVNFLTRNDVFKGSDENDQWNGFREKNTIRYFLYEYETYLREDESKSDISQLPPFEEWRQDGIQIEHIWAQNPDEELTAEELNEHETYVNSLGNLALLGPADNNVASNRPYHEKREESYPKQAMKMLDELPLASETKWRGEDIRARVQELVEFAIERWGVSTGAYVYVGEIESDDEEHVQTEVESAVRDDYYERDSEFHLPYVQLEARPVSDGWKTVVSCPQCDGTRLSIIEDETNIQYQCSGCEKQLTHPLYKIKANI